VFVGPLVSESYFLFFLLFIVLLRRSYEFIASWMLINSARFHESFEQSPPDPNAMDASALLEAETLRTASGSEAIHEALWPRDRQIPFRIGRTRPTRRTESAMRFWAASDSSRSPS